MEVKLPKINLVEFLMYPHILNVFLLFMLLTIGTFQLIFGWISKKREKGRTILYYNKVNYRELVRDIGKQYYMCFINTWYMDKDLSRTIADYKLYAFLPYYKKGSKEYIHYCNDLKRGVEYKKKKRNGEIND